MLLAPGRLRRYFPRAAAVGPTRLLPSPRRGRHRQEHFAPFKRKKVMYTYRFEEYVLRMLIGSNEEEVAVRLGISAETVELIVENQLKDNKRIDPARVIKHVGMDEISLKKRHKLYVTVMTDLTVELPVLKDVYDVRVRFKEIFDTAPDRATAEQQLAELRARTESLGLDFSKFWTTYDNWKTGILNYFDGRYTSAAVEGINNKARVITKRCYGVKSADTLWNRLLLDLNRASEAAGQTIAELREIVSGLKAVFLAFCT